MRSVASIYSAEEVDVLEKRTVPVAFSAPLAGSDVISRVASNVLGWVGLSPFVSNTPLSPARSPALWAVLAWVRRKSRLTLLDEAAPTTNSPLESSQPSTM